MPSEGMPTLNLIFVMDLSPAPPAYFCLFLVDIIDTMSRYNVGTVRFLHGLFRYEKSTRGGLLCKQNV